MAATLHIGRVAVGKGEAVGAPTYGPVHQQESTGTWGTTMSMTEAERSALIEHWAAKSSDSENDRMDRAERMVRAAIESHPAFQTDRTSVHVYAKGSYPNETNVRADSDVDVVVENRSVYYFDYIDPQESQNATADPTFVPYEGGWTPELWRTEVQNALRNHFGSSGIDTDGSVAILVKEVAGSRPSCDVVPAFEYRRYDRFDRAPSFTHQGSKIYKSSGGSIINYPFQQFRNGRTKDSRTYGKYKQFARALKSGENRLVKADLMEGKPSYLMECLAFNVKDADLSRSGNRSAWFRWALAELHNALLPDRYVYEDWIEPNGLKYLFGSEQAWSVSDARELTTKLWDYLEYE